MFHNGLKVIVNRLVSLGIVFFVCSAQADDFLVKTQSEYLDASSKLNPGDRIILANGVWRDFEILFQGVGTEQEAIT